MKKDPQLGKKIHEHLIKLGIETPMVIGAGKYKHNEQLMLMPKLIESQMKLLNLDLTDDSLKETPKRITKMFVSEIFEGLNYDNFPQCTNINNKFKADEMVIEGGINVSSTCEHHFQNIEGEAKVAYIPKNKILGLSKMNRIVRFFSKRPQVQERLVLQIQAALCFILETDNVAVEIKAVHHCVRARGIEDKNCWTTTRKLGGFFRYEDEVRNEYLNTK